MAYNVKPNMMPYVMNPNMNRITILPKPELPPHIQFLFIARQTLLLKFFVIFSFRPPLAQVKPPAKNKCRSYDPILNPHRDYLALFEENDPPERIIEKNPKQIHEEKKKHLIEENKAKNKDLLKQC